MKKVFILLFCFGLVAPTVISCREKTTVEKVADDVEDAVEDAVD